MVIRCSHHTAHEKERERERERERDSACSYMNSYILPYNSYDEAVSLHAQPLCGGRRREDRFECLLTLELKAAETLKLLQPMSTCHLLQFMRVL